MIGLDANVVVRFLVQDDEIQSPIANRIMARLTRDEPGYISSAVLAEITWVLARAYRAPRSEISQAVEGMLRSAELVVENAEAGYRALAVFNASPSVGYADALIAQTAALAGVSETVTFDRTAADEAGMRLLG